ncbi:hypothetical protein [Pseudooceanicola sp.]|jgi:hypothetical protein|uniref:hypothetical protein n=1 Tax=Pseudooceanicola sp. TaxID=1914328 RepID=UPI004059237A
MAGKAHDDDHLPASEADMVREAQRRKGHGGGTPPADPASEAGRTLSRPPEKSRGEAERDRLDHEHDEE